DHFIKVPRKLLLRVSVSFALSDGHKSKSHTDHQLCIHDWRLILSSDLKNRAIHDSAQSGSPESSIWSFSRSRLNSEFKLGIDLICWEKSWHFSYFGSTERRALAFCRRLSNSSAVSNQRIPRSPVTR